MPCGMAAVAARMAAIRSPHREDDGTVADLTLEIDGAPHQLTGTGNGSLDAVSAALRQALPNLEFRFEDYMQHAIEVASDARAATYVKITGPDDTPYWGVGVHHDIPTASVLALISAVNRKQEDTPSCQ